MHPLQLVVTVIGAQLFIPLLTMGLLAIAWMIGGPVLPLRFKVWLRQPVDSPRKLLRAIGDGFVGLVSIVGCFALLGLLAMLFS